MPQSTSYTVTALSTSAPIVQLNNGDDQALCEITGTCTGLSVTFQVSYDAGQSWFDVPAVNILTRQFVNSYPLPLNIPSDGASVVFVLLGLSAFKQYRIVTNTLSTGTPKARGRTGEFLVDPQMATASGQTQTAPVAAGKTSDTVIKANPGQLVSVLVTATGTTPVSIFDNASGHTGTVIGIIPSTATVGQVFTFNTPAASGITVQGASTNAGLTVVFQ